MQAPFGNSAWSGPMVSIVFVSSTVEITIRGTPRRFAYSTISAVPPRPREAAPSHSAMRTSLRSTMLLPARS